MDTTVTSQNKDHTGENQTTIIGHNLDKFSLSLIRNINWLVYYRVFTPKLNYNDYH